MGFSIWESFSMLSFINFPDDNSWVRKAVCASGLFGQPSREGECLTYCVSKACQKVPQISGTLTSLALKRNVWTNCIDAKPGLFCRSPLVWFCWGVQVTISVFTMISEQRQSDLLSIYRRTVLSRKWIFRSCVGLQVWFFKPCKRHSLAVQFRVVK